MPSVTGMAKKRTANTSSSCTVISHGLVGTVLPLINGNHGYNRRCHDVSVFRHKVVHHTIAMIDNVKSAVFIPNSNTQLDNLTTRYPDFRLESSFTQAVVTSALVVDQKSATNARTINATFYIGAQPDAV